MMPEAFAYEGRLAGLFTAGGSLWRIRGVIRGPEQPRS
jgi:hypothetical protein